MTTNNYIYLMIAIAFLILFLLKRSTGSIMLGTKIPYIYLILAIVFLILFFLKRESININAVKSPEDITRLFPKSPQEIDNRVKNIIENTTTKINDLINLPNEKRNFENTAKALDEITNIISQEASIFNTTMFVSPDKNLREKSKEAALKLVEFSIDNISQNKAIFNVFKYYVENISKNEKLNPEELYFLEETLKGFKRSGLNLPDEEQKNIKTLTKELFKVQQEFDKNINDDVKHVDVPESELKGLNQNFIESLPLKEKDKIKLRTLDTSYPVVDQVMQNCSVESTRKILWEAFVNRAYPANISLLDKIIKLRDKLSKKLGYKSYSQFDLEEEMAKTPEIVEKFLNEIDGKLLIKTDQEIKQQLKDLPESVTLTKEGKFKPWDWRFAREYYRKKHYNVDQRSISEYFPLQNTIESLIKIYEDFFSINFEKINSKNLWHEDVILFKLTKKSNNSSHCCSSCQKCNNNIIGWLLLDLYPRDGKFTHACSSGIVSSFKTKNNDLYPGVNVIIANFPKPTPIQPSLLFHSDVTTLFHEFGHAIHALLGATEMKSFSGTNVKTDFVEMPSQMLEEWCWDKDTLKKISKHYKTNNPLSDDLIEKMINLKNFDRGNNLRRQIMFSKLSLDYFKDGEKKDTEKIMRELSKKYKSHIELRDNDHFQASFGHLTDYGAKYYSYLWSKVYALDLFAHIKKHGLLNKEIGKEYSEKILMKGGSYEPQKLLKDFLGREPNSEAFFKDMGI